MKKPYDRVAPIGIFCLSLCAYFGCAPSSKSEILPYLSEMRGRVFGYQEVWISRLEDGGRPVILMKESGRALFSALGADFESRTEAEYRIEAATGRLLSCTWNIDQGSSKVHVSAKVEGETAWMTIEPGGREKKVALPPDVIFENPAYFPHLVKDLAENGLKTKCYRILDLLDRRVQDVSYARMGAETFRLGNNTYDAVIFDRLNHDLGSKLRLWIEAGTGKLLKTEGPQGVSSLADRSELGRLQRARLDERLLAKTGVSISDFKALAYLKVRAILEPVGLWITPEDLRVAGQSFDGRVEDNRIEGIFEIRREKYDGRGAPPFPPDFGGRPDLRPFLDPEDFIESDDPVLVRKAGELTRGASDSWEAAKRLSRWVAEEIGYDIPGGISARNTYDLREGECGAHSRLFAALSRAVGIPARVVWGCMYLPDRGGGFSQHAWNEVYLGEAGWIALDTTAKEVDFADSGHVRLGVLSSSHNAWNPQKLEILDFQAGSQKFGKAPEAGRSEKYRPFLGRYRGPRGDVYTVLVQNGGLALDIPNRMVAELWDPDDKGVWFLKVSRDISLSFDVDGSGRAIGFVLTNKVRIPKKEGGGEAAGGVPEKFLPFLGRYPVPMEKSEIVVSYRNGNLILDFPGRGILELVGPDEEGAWTVEPGGDRISFIRDDDGRVRSLILLEKYRCPRMD